MPIKLPFAAVYAYLFISMVLSPDGAHIFCRESQIKDEVKGGLEFMSYVYKIFGFTFDLKLSTRPEKYLVDLETWQKAEAALAQALDEFGKPREINEGDGTFYGQKIDITVSDAMRRKFQCATLQLDFQLHIGFNLSYSTEDESKMERPVMIHSYSWFCRKNVCHTSRALQGEMAFLAYSAPGNCLPGF